MKRWLTKAQNQVWKCDATTRIQLHDDKLTSTDIILIAWIVQTQEW